MHIQREIGAFIGDVLIDYMSKALENELVVEQTDMRYQPLGFVPFADVEVKGHCEQVARETKLRQAEFLKISTGAKIAVKQPEAMSGVAEIVGLSCNAARTVGSFHDGATGQTLHEIKPSSLFREDRRMTLVSLPFKTPLSFSDGTALLAYGYEGTRKENQPEFALELSGFVLRRSGEKQAKYAHVATAGMGRQAIDEQVSDKTVASLVKLLQDNKLA